MDNTPSPTDIFRKKFEQFVMVRKESGEEAAIASLFEGYPERQKQWMKNLIEGCTLAEGFTKAIPLYQQLGMPMKVVDISNHNVDAVLEIQQECPAMAIGADFDIKRPCSIICELDVRATECAYPDIKGQILSRLVDGDCSCVFKYERSQK